jgi:hypothetical protein
MSRPDGVGMYRPDGVAMTRLRIGLGAAGVLVGLVGVWTFVTGVPSGQWPGVFIWLGGVVVAHDALIAPAAVLVGLAVFAVVPRRLRPPMRAAALAVASVILIGLPVLMTR